MANLNGFNAAEVEPTGSFDPLPAGKYLAAITESEMKPTKNGSGNYLQLTFTIVEGEFKGRVLWARLNLNNPNATAVKIARSELSAVCHAVGVMQPRDSVELHNLPLVITVKLKKRDDTGELTNEIKGYEPKAGAFGVSGGGGGQAQQAPVTSNVPPWKR
ncbi:MAG: DUF669 domain-containing protein [Phycisphaeraceae bacterium]|nr:DUF669 domain-containing protein [Phycisphaeraceae bacterium]